MQEMTLEEAIHKTKEHMNETDKDSEEYTILQILLACAESCHDIINKLA